MRITHVNRMTAIVCGVLLAAALAAAAIKVLL